MATEIRKSAELRGQLAESGGTDQSFDSRQTQILAITDEIFSESGRLAFTVERVTDPDEQPSEPYVLIRIQCNDPIERILEKQDEWHRRVMDLTVDEPGAYRLLIDPN